MKKIFKRDPYAKIDRRKQRAEKQKMQSREKAWRKKHREESWRAFKKRVSGFIADPFAKKELSVHQQQRKQMRMLARYDRKMAWRKWWTKFRNNPWRVIIPRKKHRTADGGYQYIYHMTQLERKELRLQKRRENREHFKTLLTTRELRRTFGFGYLHSTAYFITSFMVIYIIYQIVTIAIASTYNIPVVWYYYQLKFPLYTYSPLYTRAALVVIFASGPILSLLLAFASLKLFFTKNVSLRRFQLFFLWAFICGANMFFGAYIAGFFTRTEFIYTSEWLFMSNMFDVEEIIFTIIAFITLLVMGRMVTPLFLLSSGSVTMVKPEYRLFFIFTQVVLPWLTGMVVLFLITLPTYYFPLILKTITPGLVVLPTLYLYDSLKYDNIHRSGIIQHNYFRWSIVIAVIALLFFYRVILSFGLKIM